MYCTHCGHANPDDANFCGNCGWPLRAADATTGGFRVVRDGADVLEAEDGALDVGGLLAELQPATALLVAVRGPNRGARFLLDRDVVTVGRHPDSDIFLDDITVSRRHAEFRRDGQHMWLHDVGSLNGTYVDGARVEDQVLATGDEVQIGKFKLVALVAPPPEQDG